MMLGFFDLEIDNYSWAWWRNAPVAVMVVMSVVAAVNKPWRFVVFMMPCNMTYWRCSVFCLMFHRLMPWSRFRSATFTSARSRRYWTAESYTGKNENHKLFERLVHITPSLSFLLFMRTFLAAYNRIGIVSLIF